MEFHEHKLKFMGLSLIDVKHMLMGFPLLLEIASDLKFKLRFRVKYIKEIRQSFNWVRDMTELAKAPVARLIQKAGAKRISAAAVEKMVELAEEYITKVARRAVELAKHAGRVTVKEEDIKLAAEELR